MLVILAGMLFNSIDFAIFLPIVFALYWLIGAQRKGLQNALIVLASYIFYGWWDYRFLVLILFSTVVDFFVARGMNRAIPLRSKYLLFLSLFVNLGLLGFFKYYNFFAANFVEAFRFFGMEFDIRTLRVILPVGISFYTFQTLSYSIDVYRGNIKQTDSFVSFAAFVSFFPQLVAGPIERASHLLPQFENPRSFDPTLARDGLRQILWGLFKKLVIADNCAPLVNEIFANYHQLSSIELIFGAILFAFQIYGDFSGYSDIAIGTARLFGFDLMQNFRFPYFSRDIAEFWRRWHISLSTWFRDYLYIPLGGSQVGFVSRIRNIFIIFIVSGFWHGANWTFIVWGALNALYFVPLSLTGKNRRYLGEVAAHRWLPSGREALNIGSTFMLTVLAWVFFRSDCLSDAFAYLQGIFTFNLNSEITLAGASNFSLVWVLIAIFLIVEWVGRRGAYGLEFLGDVGTRFHRWPIYLAIIGALYFFGNYSAELEFIYFQF